MTDIEKNRHNHNGKPEFRDRSKPVDSNPPKIIDLFCGAGGISAGFSNAGFETVMGTDIHAPSIETFRSNHPEAATILGDMREVEKEMLEEGVEGLDIDVLTAGIPCQGFSIANKKRSDEDERNYLFREFMKSLEPIKPDYILIENVSTIESAKNGEFVDDIKKALEERGYHVSNQILNAAKYGVPQKRRRMFFLGAKKGLPIDFPDQELEEKNFWTVKEAISDLPELEARESENRYSDKAVNKYQSEMRESEPDTLNNHKAPNHQSKTVERIKNTQPGEPMYEKFKQRVRLDPNSASPTLVAGGIRPQFLFGHPSQNRGLTVRERARIQSFRDDYKFETGLVQGRVLTGNAVPPKLAESIAESIKDSFKYKGFSQDLLEWWERNSREFEWRDTESPYETLIAEFLLRKTQAENVEPIYNKFLNNYPEIRDLAGAEQKEIEDLLKPLGLQETRSKALKEIASQCAMENDIPRKEEDLLELPHIGRYIANATLCFAFGERKPIVDSNVERVLSEIMNIDEDGQTHQNDRLWRITESLIPEGKSKEFNLALLDLGAEIRKNGVPKKFQKYQVGE